MPEVRFVYFGGMLHSLLTNFICFALFWQQFSSAEASTSKVCDSSLTRKLLGWEPRHTSFRVFMRRLGGENVADAPHKHTAKVKAEEYLLN